MENAIYQKLDTETQEKLEKVLAEIQVKTSSVFLKGLHQTSPTSLKELKKFEVRLVELGLDYLAAEFNRFGKSAQKVIGSQSSFSKKQSQAIEEVVRTFIRITTYLRVFERVQSRSLNLKNIQDDIRENIMEDEQQLTADQE